MYYFIFNKKNDYSWHGIEPPVDIMVDHSMGQFVVQLPDDCFSEIPDDEHQNILYSPETGGIVLDVNRFVLPSKRAEEDLENQLREYMLIPPEQRDSWYPELMSLAEHFLPQELIEEITSDSVLSQEEAQQILDYLG